MKLTARKDVGLDDDYVEVRYRELTPTICDNVKGKIPPILH